MIPNLTKSGLLPAGVHPATWEELVAKFGFNGHRLNMLNGLKKGLNLLYGYGCREVCIDGSFTTSKPFPNDVDVCYDNTHISWKKFLAEQPEFGDMIKGRTVQKAKYHSEFYPYNAFDDHIFQFFQFDRENNPKGIVKLYLTGRLL